MDNEELLKNLKIKRNIKFFEYDKLINQLQRKIRLSTSEEEIQKITDKIKELDNYAEELCDITNMPGCPWSGFCYDIPWPELPKISD